MAYDIYLALQGNIYTKISGVTGESTEDVTYYDGSLYDLSVSAAFNGGTTSALGAAASSFSVGAGGGGALGGVLCASSASTAPAAAATGTLVVLESDAINLGIPAASKAVPAAQSKKRTRYKWTTATGTYWAWADNIVAVSLSPFGYWGSSIPAPYTSL